MTVGKRLAILHAPLVLASCVNSSFRGDFSLFSPVGVPNQYQIIDPHIVGRSCFRWYELVFAAFVSTDRPVVEEAVEHALSQAPGADALAMVDVRVSGGCYEVEGAAISTGRSP
jgi:hypothetical protein